MIYKDNKIIKIIIDINLIAESSVSSTPTYSSATPSSSTNQRSVSVYSYSISLNSRFPPFSSPVTITSYSKPIPLPSMTCMLVSLAPR